MSVNVRFQIAGYPAADWTLADPVLLERELAVESDTGKAKVGDGATAWGALPYFIGTAAAKDTGTSGAKIPLLNAANTWSSAQTLASLRLGAGGPTWTAGAGSPESVVAAPVGSLYSRTDGGAATTLYVKESGAGDTGWVAK